MFYDGEASSGGVSAVRAFWELNTVESQPDNKSTLIGFEEDTTFEMAIFSETEVFFGFEGTYTDNNIQTLGILV